jgi:hypothetical protein
MNHKEKHLPTRTKANINLVLHPVVTEAVPEVCEMLLLLQPDIYQEILSVPKFFSFLRNNISHLLQTVVSILRNSNRFKLCFYIFRTNIIRFDSFVQFINLYAFLCVSKKEIEMMLFSQRVEAIDCKNSLPFFPSLY